MNSDGAQAGRGTATYPERNKPCLSAMLSAVNPTCIGLRLDPCLRRQMPQINVISLSDVEVFIVVSRYHIIVFVTVGDVAIN